MKDVTKSSACPLLAATFGIAILAILNSNVVQAQTVVAGPFDFETAGQYAANFHAVSDVGEIGQTTGLANNYIQFNNNSAANAAFYYGNNASTSLEPTFGGTFTAQFDVSAVTANSAFGLYLVNPANTGNSILAYFNLDTSGTSDEIRFFANGNPAAATTTAGTLLTSGITGTGGSLSSGAYIGSSGLNVSPDTVPVWGTMDITYTPGTTPNTTTLSLELGSLSATITLPDSEAIIDPELAIRMVDGGNGIPGTAKVDNFEVLEPTPTPEPSTYALFGIGLGIIVVKTLRKKLS